jgi:hypothetical protein
MCTSKGVEMKFGGDLEVRKIPEGGNLTCGCTTGRPAVVYFNGSPTCASCFGAELLAGGDDRHAMLGYFCSLLLKD